jgi:GDPmannose 4,6-dehydratase
VIGTVQTHTVREFVQIVFEELELNYEDQLFFYPRFYCPTEVEILVANSAKDREKLGWNPKVNFKELALNMVRADYDLLMKNK